nr:MAG: capsid protein [Canine parvovirus]
MAETVSFKNSYMAYWENNPYVYPSKTIQNQTNLLGINTGWHVLPTMLWEHFLTCKQWYSMVHNYEAYHVNSTKITVFNPVPITEQIAIQGTTTFTAFNNTLYSIGCSDKLYETSWHNWWDQTSNILDRGQWWNFNLAYKEGFNKTTNKRIMLPLYTWRTPQLIPADNHTWSWNTEAYVYNTEAVWPTENRGNNIPTGIFWDPLAEPQELLELRPGKNAISYGWECHGCDEGIWYNFDLLAYMWPYKIDGPFNPSLGGFQGTQKISQTYQDPTPQTSYTTEGTRAYDMPDLRHMPIVPIYWFWKEMQNTFSQPAGKIQENPSMYASGTEYGTHKYPPTQHFIKGLPIFNENGTLITTSTLGAFTVEINLSCKKRRSKIHAPTWGPESWNMTHTIDGPFCLPVIRYRTGGARRPWATISQQLHGTMPTGPYIPNTTYQETETTPTATYTQARGRETTM